MRFFDGRTQMEVAEEIGSHRRRFPGWKDGSKNIRRYIGEERGKE